MHKRLCQQLVLAGLAGAAMISPAAFAHPDQAPHKHDDDSLYPALPPMTMDPAEAARRAEVVATYDAAKPGSRGEITVGMVEDAVGSSSEFTQQRFVDPDGRKVLLDRALRYELLAAEAERRGYDKNASVVQSVKQNAVQAMLKKDIDAKVTPLTVTPDEVKKYYEEHIAEFVRPEMRRASQVLLATEAEAKAVSAEAKAADVRGFRELARRKSQDEASKLRGGDLRYFDAKGKPDDTAPNVDPAIVKAVFALKTVGDTSGVVKTEAGFAVLKLTSIRPAQEHTLKQSDERIRMRLWRAQRESAIDALVAKLKQESNPTTHPELLDAIVFSTEGPVPPNTGLPYGFPHTKPPAVPTPKE